MEDILPLLIPIIGVSIPLVVVVGRFVVQPILETLNKQAELQSAARDSAPLAQRLAATEDRVAQLEKSLELVLETQEFQGKLLTGRPDPARETPLSRTDPR